MSPFAELLWPMFAYSGRATCQHYETARAHKQDNDNNEVYFTFATRTVE